ncbi:unnamed protein product [Ambrosiozyma monospora]|uniref:Unnamed protein product n=1 Tax=Ambrosiozyma monospora TaxID=43982 RepID=A0ACB5U7D1_AMBMO|nr:unnamed protein product [Ambrosiozyma monospora]
MWNSVLKIAADEAALFDQSTRKMGKDIIAPLKLFNRHNDSNLVEMDDLCTLAGNIAKREKKGEDTSLLTNEWSQRAPYFFEIFENYDYSRLILLKDVFMRYETDLADVIEVFRKDNEAGTEHVLSFNANDEIKRFADAAMAKEFPVELIKSVETIKPGASHSTAHSGFTSTATQHPARDHANNVSAATKKSHRHSLMPHKRESVLVPPGGGEAHRRASTASTRTSGSAAQSTKDTEKKGGLRSKFGTLLRGGKKKNKKSELSNNAIPESDDSSLLSAPGNYVSCSR